MGGCYYFVSGYAYWHSHMAIETPEFVLAAGLALLLATTCVTDWRERNIPNWLTGAIALAAPLFWWAAGIELWPDAGIHLGVALVTFAIGAALFHFGAMGGGDVKLLVALALWFPALSFVKLVFVMSIVGGILTLALLVHHRRLARPGNPEIPYGIAIAAAGLWGLYERYLNHFV